MDDNQLPYGRLAGLRGPKAHKRAVILLLAELYEIGLIISQK
jgi:hypothetical protein